VFKMILGLFLFSYNLSASEERQHVPNRAGTVPQMDVPGQRLRQAIFEIEQEKREQKEHNESGWSRQKESSVVPRAGTVPNPCHRPDNHPHEGNSHKGLPNPYSRKKH